MIGFQNLILVAMGFYALALLGRMPDTAATPMPA